MYQSVCDVYNYYLILKGGAKSGLVKQRLKCKIITVHWQGMCLVWMIMPVVWEKKLGCRE